MLKKNKFKNKLTSSCFLIPLGKYFQMETVCMHERFGVNYI